jgi:hypothetical protein
VATPTRNWPTFYASGLRRTSPINTGGRIE